MPTKMKRKKPMHRSRTSKSTKDPVCGAMVTEESGVRATEEGMEIRFCSLECKQKYEDNSSSTGNASFE